MLSSMIASCRAASLRRCPVLQGNGALVAAPSGGKWFRETRSMLRGGWRNWPADRLVRAAHLPIVYSWNESVPLHEYHRDNGDGHECTCVWLGGCCRLLAGLLCRRLLLFLPLPAATSATPRRPRPGYTTFTEQWSGSLQTLRPRCSVTLCVGDWG